MVAIPTVEEEDARRPNRERGNLVTEQTRIVNQIKAVLTRFGIRTFRPTLRKAEEQLEGLRTAEGAPLLENTRAELAATSRGYASCASTSVRSSRPPRQARNDPEKGRHAMVRLIARVLGVGVSLAAAGKTTLKKWCKVSLTYGEKVEVIVVGTQVGRGRLDEALDELDESRKEMGGPILPSPGEGIRGKVEW